MKISLTILLEYEKTAFGILNVKSHRWKVAVFYANISGVTGSEAYRKREAAWKHLKSRQTKTLHCLRQEQELYRY